MVGQRGAVLGSGTTGSVWRARRRRVKRGRRAPAHEAREKFKVGCPSTGGLWVAEFDTAVASVKGGQSAASLETNNSYNKTPSDYSIKGKKMKVPELEKH